MDITEQQMTAVFNEWAKRYSKNSDSFGPVLDNDGKAVAGYGERCTIYFRKIGDEMTKAGILPTPN